MSQFDKRVVGAVIVFIFCFVVGMGIAVNHADGTMDRAYVSAKSIEGNLVQAEAEKAEIEKLKTLIDVCKEKLDFYRSEETSLAQQNEAANKACLEAMAAAGYMSMEGPGVTIILDDGAGDLKEWEAPSDIVVHDLDILILLDDLVAAGAEAISINGQRYVSTTEVTCSGHTVKINGVKCARPFVFKVIGDPDSLYSEMTIQGSYGTILKECGLVFEVEKSDKLYVEACENGC